MERATSWPCTTNSPSRMALCAASWMVTPPKKGTGWVAGSSAVSARYRRALASSRRASTLGARSGWAVMRWAWTGPRSMVGFGSACLYAKSAYSAGASARCRLVSPSVQARPRIGACGSGTASSSPTSRRATASRAARVAGRSSGTAAALTRGWDGSSVFMAASKRPALLHFSVEAVGRILHHAVKSGVARSRLSTTGFSILGLLALRPWSAYELTQQIHRSLRYLWPASERNLYAEPKRLAAAGLVRMRREAVGRHLATPPAPPQLEFEALQRLFYADQGSKQDLLAALDATSRQVEQLLHDGLQQVRGYQTDGGPFPQRLHLIMLFTRFYADFLLLVRDWVALARREVASWPTTSDLGLTDGTRRILEDLLRQGDQLTAAPGRASTERAATEGSPSRRSEADGEGRPGSLPA